ncbi:MAG: aldo/keto reductase [Candidatus Aminicenantes bacterium 4484_214]|nr:MAG: aldo/keto reductase [Candidatus Aminicenantes bacterium 4484_214]
MEYRFLGKTGIKVSKLCLGTMTFGGDADEKESEAMFNYCREQGINFFDTADVYTQGRSEEILGRLIKDCREEVIVATKVYFPTSEDVNARGSSRRHIFLSVEGSLRRLKTDFIDLLYLHRFDDFTALEETLRALDDLVRQGKVMYIGASNFAAWQVEKSLGLQGLHNWVSFVCLQPMYNLVKRQAEVEILPMAQAENLAVCPYSPLGGGLLTGKYTTSTKPQKGRLVENKMYRTRYGAKWMYEVAEKFVALARELGHHPISLAIAWVASHPAVTAPIIGGRNLAQLRPSVEAAKIEINEDLRQKISSLSPEPPPATDRNEERSPYTFGQR